MNPGPILTSINLDREPAPRHKKSPAPSRTPGHYQMFLKVRLLKLKDKREREKQGLCHRVMEHGWAPDKALF